MRFVHSNRKGSDSDLSCIPVVGICSAAGRVADKIGSVQ